MADEDATLLAALADGREEAFQELICRYSSALLRAAGTLLGDGTEAEDMVQEVLVSLVRSRTRLRHVRHLSAYLFTVLRRAAVRRIQQHERDAQHRRAWFAQAPVRSPAVRDTNAPHAEGLRQAVARLPLAQREVLALRLDAGLSFREIGEALGISTNTAASRYRYAIARLRDELQVDEE